jgi:hypothetical protein
MGISLTGLTPATTYDALIKVGDNGPIDGTLKVLSDGLGTNLPMEASTTGVNFTGNLTQSGTALQPVLVSGTNIKTINSTSILGSGNIAVQPTLVSGTSIKTVNSNSLLGSGDVAVQETLVSGTNIKTLNNTSLLGSGNITLTANPSGVSGAIQFSNGSAFASDAANLFWDDTNNRLGVGTNAPASQLEIKGNDYASFQISGGIAGRRALFSYLNAPSVFEFDVSNILRIKNGSTYSLYTDTTGSVGIGTLSPSARTHIKGSGSTSATTALLVQNSAGTSALTVKDDSSVLISAGSVFGFGDTLNYAKKSGAIDGVEIAGFSGVGLGAFGGINTFVVRSGSASLGATTANASAIFDITSTTKGFLPPRGTNTQMNAIASPATGLVFYDTTNNKLCVYNATSWIPLH